MPQQHLSDTAACSIPKHYPYYNPGGIPKSRPSPPRPAPATWTRTRGSASRSTCTVIVGNLLVYRDDNHITATYANWLTPAIGAQLESLTDGAF